MINGLITGSNTTAEDVREYFGERAARVFIVFAGDDAHHTFLDVIEQAQREEHELDAEGAEGNANNARQ